jgi:xanthosine phosphorylase
VRPQGTTPASESPLPARESAATGEAGGAGVAQAAAAALLDRAARPPRVGIVLGSGLGAVADAVRDGAAVGYDELPGFPRPGVAGHAGRAVLGELAGVPVAVLQGRQHLYEAPPPEAISTPVRALRLAGADILILTNAAGSLRQDLGPGRLMAISDHINLTGSNPLVGPNDDALGPRFPSLRDAYDPELRANLHVTADDLGIPLVEGVYLAVSGPSFETPAEIRAFRTLGADAVGMSTVHETILARHAGLRVVAISTITNFAEGLSDEPLTHEQTLRDAERAAGALARLLEAFVGRLR